MKQRRFIYLLVILFASIGCCFGLVTAVQAQSTNQVVIRDSDNIQKGRTYQLWQINQHYSTALESQLAKLSVTDLTETYSRTVVSDPTDDFGSTRVPDLGEGLYYGLELDSNGKRQATTQPFFISVTPDLSSRTLIVNPKSDLARGSLIILKKGIDPEQKAEDEKALQGVVFELYYHHSETPISFVDGKANTDGAGSSLLVTDEVGMIKVSELVPGDYVLKEVQPLEGYQVLDSPISLQIRADEETEVTVENLKTNLGGFKFRKVDATQATQGLAGATFQVMQENEVVVASVQSDEDGYFEVVDLPYGAYQLVETKAPVVDGVIYQLLEEPIEFDITGASYYQEYVLAVSNHPTGTPALPPSSLTMKPPFSPSRLPFTGEKSRTLKTLLAWSLILFAAILILNSRSKNHHEKDETHE